MRTTNSIILLELPLRYSKPPQLGQSKHLSRFVLLMNCCATPFPNSSKLLTTFTTIYVDLQPIRYICGYLLSNTLGTHNSLSVNSELCILKKIPVAVLSFSARPTGLATQILSETTDCPIFSRWATGSSDKSRGMRGASTKSEVHTCS